MQDLFLNSSMCPLKPGGGIARMPNTDYRYVYFLSYATSQQSRIIILCCSTLKS